jgi:hypothetical protein
MTSDCCNVASPLVTKSGPILRYTFDSKEDCNGKDSIQA